MLTDTIVAPEAAEAFLRTSGILDLSIGIDPGPRFSALCYWPHGDSIRGKFCCGHGNTLPEALERMHEKLDAAKAQAKKLKTAAECKEAVLDLIREHDAAPASFRDAVDQLQVQ